MTSINVESVFTKFKKFFNLMLLVGITALFIKLGMVIFTKNTQRNLDKKNSSCPSLLSISRSARDTLIVMKAEHLCNEYVLDSLR